MSTSPLAQARLCAELAMHADESGVRDSETAQQARSVSSSSSSKSKKVYCYSLELYTVLCVDCSVTLLCAVC